MYSSSSFSPARSDSLERSHSPTRYSDENNLYNSFDPVVSSPIKEAASWDYARSSLSRGTYFDSNGIDLATRVDEETYSYIGESDLAREAQRALDVQRAELAALDDQEDLRPRHYPDSESPIRSDSLSRLSEGELLEMQDTAREGLGKIDYLSRAGPCVFGSRTTRMIREGYM